MLPDLPDELFPMVAAHLPVVALANLSLLSEALSTRVANVLVDEEYWAACRNDFSRLEISCTLRSAGQQIPHVLARSGNK